VVIRGLGVNDPGVVRIGLLDNDIDKTDHLAYQCIGHFLFACSGTKNLDSEKGRTYHEQ
jgi:hypothetical protein